MQIALHNSKLTLLLPKGYERVGNGASLYPEMYQKRKAEDVEMFQSLPIVSRDFPSLNQGFLTSRY